MGVGNPSDVAILLTELDVPFNCVFASIIIRLMMISCGVMPAVRLITLQKCDSDKLASLA